jgi:PIN domain nuclease of toxin-antitoxin system
VNLLLDTHIALWWLGDTPELPDAVREVVQDADNVVYISAATIWEIAIKRALGKLEVGDEYLTEIAEQGFVELPIRWQHAQRVEALPMLHRDPFDRLLIAQAQTLGLTLVTTDALIRKYSVSVLPLRA